MMSIPTRLALLALTAVLPWQLSLSREPDSPLARAKAILDESPVVDGHNDLPWVIREKFAGNVEGYDISKAARYDTDIPRLREGRVPRPGLTADLASKESVYFGEILVPIL